MKATLKKTAQGQLILTNVRVAYPDLYEAKPFKNDPKNTPRFGVTVLVPKDSPKAIEALEAEINKLAKEKLKVTKLAAKDSCFTDGDEKANEAMHGHMVLSLYSYPSEKMENGGAPKVVDMRQKPIEQGAKDVPYSGCYANVMFDLYTPSSWKKVSGGLRVVQRHDGNDGEVIGFTTDMSEMPMEPDAELGGEDDYGI